MFVNLSNIQIEHYVFFIVLLMFIMVTIAVWDTFWNVVTYINEHNGILRYITYVISYQLYT